MWWAPGPYLKRRVIGESCQELQFRSTTSFLDAKATEDDLLNVLCAKFGTITRAWRIGLDVDQSGTLDFTEFVSALKRLGYCGNLRSLWFNLDDDNSGLVSLKELDPDAAAALEKFRYLCNSKYSNIQTAWKKAMDIQRSGTMNLNEFQVSAKGLGYTDSEEVAYLFDLLLLKPGMSYITLHDIEFLQVWEESKQHMMFRKRFLTKWVNRDPFLMVSANQSVFSQTLPSLVSKQDSENFENMCAFDEDQIKRDFQDFLRARYGSLSNAFDVMDANGSGSLSMVEFQTSVVTVLRYCRPAEARRLFLSFTTDPDATISWDELGISSQEWVTFRMEKKLKRTHVASSRRRNQLGEAGSVRHGEAIKSHTDRLRNPLSKADVAFGMPLPRGWGLPHNRFEPRLLPRLPHSAR